MLDTRVIVWNSPGTAMILRGTEMPLFRSLPSLADCLIDEVFKCLNGIPEDFGLLLDRQAGRIRVFQIEDTGILDILQRLTGDAAPSPALDEEVGEGLQTDDGQADDVHSQRYFILTRHRACPILTKGLL